MEDSELSIICSVQYCTIKCNMQFEDLSVAMIKTVLLDAEKNDFIDIHS